MVTLKSKSKEKILIYEESKTEEKEDIDATLEKAISKAIRTKEAKKGLTEIIARIIAELPVTTTYVPTAATPRASNKKK